MHRQLEESSTSGVFKGGKDWKVSCLAVKGKCAEPYTASAKNGYQRLQVVAGQAPYGSWIILRYHRCFSSRDLKALLGGVPWHSYYIFASLLSFLSCSPLIWTQKSSHPLSQVETWDFSTRFLLWDPCRSQKSCSIPTLSLVRVLELLWATAQLCLCFK